MGNPGSALKYETMVSTTLCGHRGRRMVAPSVNTVYGPCRPFGGGGTVSPVKLLKEGRLSGLDETVCHDPEFRALGAVSLFGVSRRKLNRG